MKKLYLLLLLCLILGRVSTRKKRESGNKGRCQVCKDFVKGFNAGLKNTEKNSYAGGDTSWEEENQKVYSKSEVRLVEVVDGICSGDDYQCSRFLEKYEEDIEKWWLKLKDNGHPDFLQWLCYDHADVCCPKGTYGPQCEECPGGKDNPCSGHGVCKGEYEKEVKEGSGTCKCKSGYRGELCELCKSVGYYMDDKKNCQKCDKSCKDSCNGPGASNCTECAKGYERDEPDQDCEDIDECDNENADCKEGTYCHNTAGSYDCRNCDTACKHTCTGPTPTKCDECADGYRNESGYCRDINECIENLANCKDGTWCDNLQGTYKCKDCDEVCQSTCTKGGPEGCTSCKEGYSMVEERCEDIDECQSSPCNPVSEKCINEPGSYKCKCNSGYTRVQGKCTSWEEAEILRNQETPKRKKNKKTKNEGEGGTTAPSSQSETAKTDSTTEAQGQPTDTPTTEGTQDSTSDKNPHENRNEL